MSLSKISEKKLKRLENRKRKLTALANIAKLNDQDRQVSFFNGVRLRLQTITVIVVKYERKWDCTITILLF